MQFLQFASLKNIPGLRHAVTTRGEGSGPYDALNLGYHVGDDAARVTENRKALAQELGYDATRLVAAQQVHGASSHVVTAADAGRGAFDWDTALPDCDAIIVAEPNVPVLIQVADCAPILLVDPKNHVLAVVHAGWRGAVDGIAFEVAQRMKSDFGSNPANIVAGIGPCLCAKHLEVGAEVVRRAEPYYPQSIANKGSQTFFSLRAALEVQLQEARLHHRQITTKKECPQCKNHLFFSHRGQNGTAGRFGIVAWWEE